MLTNEDKYHVCNLCGSRFQNLAYHIARSHKDGYTSKKYYDEFLREPKEGFCVTCDKEARFIKFSRGYSNYCCRKCQFNDPKLKPMYEKSRNILRTNPESMKKRIKSMLSNPNYLKAQSEKMKRFHREGIIDMGKENARRLQNPEYVKKISKGWFTPERLSDPEFQRKAHSSAGRLGPNNLEKQAFQLMESVVPGIFKYVGDYKVRIGGRYPDFINEDLKLIIEVFGEYYHEKSDEAFKIEHYKKYNYMCLVLWQSDIYYNKEQVKLAISNFLIATPIGDDRDIMGRIAGNSLEPLYHNVVGNDRRDGSKKLEDWTISSRSFSKENEGSETRESNLKCNHGELSTSIPHLSEMKI